jgi:hypothetical protein
MLTYWGAWYSRNVCLSFSFEIGWAGIPFIIQGSFGAQYVSRKSEGQLKSKREREHSKREREHSKAAMGAEGTLLRAKVAWPGSLLLAAI